jgi:hypothetical protein
MKNSEQFESPDLFEKYVQNEMDVKVIYEEKNWVSSSIVLLLPFSSLLGPIYGAIAAPWAVAAATFGTVSPGDRAGIGAATQVPWML